MEEPKVERVMLSVINWIDRYIGDWSGKILCWLIIPMVVGVAYEVVMRYLFDAPTVWAYDSTYMLYGSHFMLGAAYTLRIDGHIRTDLFYDKWSPRTQGIVDAVCYTKILYTVNSVS